MHFLAAIILTAVCGGLCYAMLRQPTVFVIRVSRGTIRFRGKFPMARRTEVEAFLSREFADRGPISISGVKADKGRMRFVIRGPISEGDRQQIRNFLQTLV